MYVFTISIESLHYLRLSKTFPGPSWFVSGWVTLSACHKLWILVCTEPYVGSGTGINGSTMWGPSGPGNDSVWVTDGAKCKHCVGQRVVGV